MHIANESELLAAVSKKLPKVDQALVLAPHPDDEVFGCAGTLCLLREAGARIAVHILTDGAHGGDNSDGRLPEIRAKESSDALQGLGLSEPVFWGMPDRGLCYGELLVSRIMETVKLTGANLVFLPSLVELHPDHQVVAFAGMEAMRRLGGDGKIAFYELSNPLPNPNLYIDISAVAQKKQQAMACFHSQLAEQPYIERISGLNAFRSYSLGASVTRAEAFILIDAADLEGAKSILIDGTSAYRNKLGFAATAEDLPLVSIVVRSMDLSTLDEALASVALQTYANVEVVVVNAKGGEHRPPGESCGRFPLRLVNQGGEPLPRARAANFGLDAVSGAYIGFLDDDDTLNADHVALLMSAQEKSGGTVACYSAVRCLDRQKSFQEHTTFAEPGVDFSRLLMGNVIPIHSVLFPTFLLQQGVRFDETLDLYEDWDFWLQMSRQIRFEFVDQVTATYYSSGGSEVGLGEKSDESKKQLTTREIFRKWLGKISPEEFQFLSRHFYADREQIKTSQGQLVIAMETAREQHDAALEKQAILAQSLLDSNQKIEALQQSLTEKNTHIEALQQSLTVENQQIEALQQSLTVESQQVAELTQLNQELLSSRSWRLTEPLRSSKANMLKLHSLQRSVRQTITDSGGLGSAFKKSISVVQKEGFEGIKDRVKLRLPAGDARPDLKAEDLHVNNPTTELYAHEQTVDVIICVHNALDEVKRCLNSVLASSLPPSRVIIVDDGSGEETRDFLDAFVPGQPIKLIRNETALGYTKAANVGLRASTAEFVVLLNSDTIVTWRWLDRLVRCSLSDEQIGMVGPLSNTASWQSVPTIFDEQGDWAENSLPEYWSLLDYADGVARASRCIYPRVGFLNGFCLLLKREMIDDLGLFDEETFGRGYGEENDYCLRAKEQGWQLAIADDCYVYHAQSKSYSHEKRQKLTHASDEALARKHGQALINDQVAHSRFHPALFYARERCRQIPHIKKVRDDIVHRFEGKRVLFLLPAETAGGGGNIVILECALMRELGVDACICNLQRNRETFEKHHPALTVPVLYLQRPEDLERCAEDFDVVIATLYLTVFWMKPLLKMANPPLLGYYIQDYEPDFFAPESVEYQKAIDSYTYIPEMLLFTKTKWNRALLSEKIGVLPCEIGPSLNMDLFCPSMQALEIPDQVRITAMVRPSTPRRAPEMTMRVLRYLKRKYGQQVKISVFGVAADAPEYQSLALDFEHQCLGELSTAQVAEVLKQNDIFIDCSIFQAMGLTAMEAMACGTVTIGPQNGGLQEIIVHEETGLLVDTQNEKEIIDAARSLVENPQKRREMCFSAFSVLEHAPEISVYRMLTHLFDEEARQSLTAEQVGRAL